VEQCHGLSLCRRHAEQQLLDGSLTQAIIPRRWMLGILTAGRRCCEAGIGPLRLDLESGRSDLSDRGRDRTDEGQSPDGADAVGVAAEESTPDRRRPNMTRRWRVPEDPSRRRSARMICNARGEAEHERR